MKKIIPYDDYNGKIPPPDKWNYVGTVTPQFGALALRHGWKIIEFYEDERIEESRQDSDSAV